MNKSRIFIDEMCRISNISARYRVRIHSCLSIFYAIMTIDMKSQLYCTLYEIDWLVTYLTRAIIIERLSWHVRIFYFSFSDTSAIVPHVYRTVANVLIHLKVQHCFQFQQAIFACRLSPSRLKSRQSFTFNSF
jgi:hypothetical protein